MIKFLRTFPIITFIIVLLTLPVSAEENLGNRGLMYTPQDIRSQVNHGGPEDWPEDEGLSTSRQNPMPASGQIQGGGIPQSAESQPFGIGQNAQFPGQETPGIQTPATTTQTTSNAPTEQSPQQGAAPATASVTTTPAGVETHVPQAGSSVSGRSSSGQVDNPTVTPPPAVEQPPREVIYVDEQGNPVPKPPEPDKMYADALKLMEEGKYEDALALLEQIRQIPGIDKNMLENVLYGISDCLWARYSDNPLAGFEPIVSATNEALNANLRSPRVPDALLRLGLANIKAGNLGDAAGYIVALMRRFPDFPGVAQGFTALGEAQLKEGQNAQAEQSFGIILDKYPESSQLEAASVGLSRALVNQGKHDRAQIILDFISKRWPRYYINDPEFLLMQAANDEKMNRDDQALALDWLYVNLDPSRAANAPLLLKMGDSYMKKGNPQAANFVYETLARDFPDSLAATTAKMRLAEKGIFDSPINYDQMSKVFDKSTNPTLWRVYSEIADSKKGTPEQVLSQLKQAMWLFWDKQYPEAMGKAVEFIDNYPEHQDIGEAREILWDAFQKEMEQSLKEQNYGRILLLWNGFPYIRERYGKMDAPLRYALSQGWLERGDEEKSFELLTDFLKDPMDPDYGEAAFSQFFNHYLKNQNWDKILELGKLVQNWNMKPELRSQLDYAEALSAQNLNLGAAALNRWKNLASRTDIPLYQQAYATYFLAKDAENRRDIKNAYEGNRRVVEMFTQLADERSDKADPERIKESILSLMDICEVGNRIPEAMQWLARYNAFVPESSAEYPGVRFREARLYRKLGDNTRAQAILENIAKNFPASPFAEAASAELRTFEVSRDLQRFMEPAPTSTTPTQTGSTSGNWSSSTPGQ